MGFSLIGDHKQDEIELENSVNVCALQRYRWVVFSHEEKPTDIAGLLRVEVRLRENTQAQMRLTAKLQEALTDPLQKMLIPELQEQIAKLSSEYWDLEMQWWEIKCGFYLGPLTRGIDFWRAQPRWYMHPVLIEDCAGRGGCCARGCGCCVRRERQWGRKLAAGHCTAECGCCEKARGFELSDEQKTRLRKLIQPENGTVHYEKIRFASLLGLEVGNFENPLDRINAPKIYWMWAGILAVLAWL
ncbi:unnamed protein product [Penicillium olsonii]|nr:unnamed protein product [Penicillium olsonii]CAG7926137.1 unnamed protein product [Penicillium olsonii]